MIFLKPEMVTDAMFAELGCVSPTRQFAEEQEERKRLELERLREEFEPRRVLKQELDARAASHVNRMSWLAFSGLTGVIGVKWYLSYIYFSWDIMEPVTYFTNASMVTVAFWWWITTNTDYQYSNIYEYFRAKRATKQYLKADFGLEQCAHAPVTPLLALPIAPSVAHPPLRGPSSPFPAPRQVPGARGPRAARPAGAGDPPAHRLQSPPHQRLPGAQGRGRAPNQPVQPVQPHRRATAAVGVRICPPQCHSCGGGRGEVSFSCAQALEASPPPGARLLPACRCSAT